MRTAVIIIVGLVLMMRLGLLIVVIAMVVTTMTIATTVVSMAIFHGRGDSVDNTHVNTSIGDD